MKLYVCVREDLGRGHEHAQIMHATVEFAIAHPQTTRAWYQQSNTVVCLYVPDEAAVTALAERCRLLGVEHSLFREPDRDNEATAIAVGPRGQDLLRGLSLVR